VDVTGAKNVAFLAAERPISGRSRHRLIYDFGHGFVTAAFDSMVNMTELSGDTASGVARVSIFCTAIDHVQACPIPKRPCSIPQERTVMTNEE
jgi:hypothetical protein